MNQKRQPPVRLGGRTTIAEQAVTEMLGRVLPDDPETPDSTDNPDVPRLDVCAFNSSI